MKSVNTKIENLLLDPNNYRLHSHPKYITVEEDNIDNPLVQKRVQKMIEGENREKIHDLIDSFMANGFLKLDNILVKKQNEKYIVIEGNRRVTALKALYDDYENGYPIGNLDANIFHNVPIVIYDNDEQSYEVLMALRHVSGVKEWDDYEQSELIMNLKQKFQMSESEISERLGLHITKVKRRINSFIAMERYKEDEDYSTNFKSSLAGIFYEVMSKPNIRDWLGWEEALGDFNKRNNLKRFFSWISPDDDGNEAIITKRDEIRYLDKFIKDDEALKAMEEKRSITEGLEQSAYYTKQGFLDNINQIKTKLGKITTASLIDLDTQTQEIVSEIVNTLEKNIIAIRKIISSNIGD